MMKKIVLLLWAFLPFCSFGQVAQTVRIGVLLNLSGIDSARDLQVKNGLLLAVNEMNESGSVKIRLDILNSKGSLQLAKEKSIQLIHQFGSKILISGSSNEENLSLIPIIEENKAFLFSTAANSPMLSNYSENFARNYPSYEAEAAASASFVRKEFQAKNAAIIYLNSKFNLGLENEFSHAFYNLGGEVIAAEGYATGTVDFTEMIQKIKKKKPDCIFLDGQPKDMGVCIKQLRKIMPSIKIMANSHVLNKVCLQIAGQSANGMIVPALFFHLNNSHHPKGFDFYRKYLKRYKVPPTRISANAYDALYLMKDAIEKVGSDPLAIAQYIRNRKNFKGVLGTVSFSDGDILLPYRFMVIKKGKAEPYN